MFSPYYAAARRRGRGDPLNHCALNVALYGGAKRWTMTERGRAALTRDADHLAIGPSTLAFDGTSLVIDINEVAVPWPRRVRGTVRLTFDAMTPRSFRLDGDGAHRWWPIAPCARAEVALAQPALRWSGHAYLDTNNGDVPLETSFASWQWSRTMGKTHAAILYDVVERGGVSRTLSLRIGRDGSGAEADGMIPAALPPTLWRVPRATRATPGTPVAVIETLEDAPFYARSLLATQIDGAPATAVHESLSLERFDSRWVQLMLPFRMPRRFV